MHPWLRAFVWSCGLSSVVVAGVLAAYLWAANELHGFDSAVARDDALYGPAFAQFNAAYKLERARLLHRDVLVLGSSRATQFRAAMFPGAGFFNAGGAAGSFDEALGFVRALYPSAAPKVLLLTVDTWWFRPGLGRGGCAEEGGNCGQWSLRKLVANTVSRSTDPRVPARVLEGRRSGLLGAAGDPLGQRAPIGFLAAYYGNGYRPDGSYQYGDIITDRAPYYDEQKMGFRNGFAMYSREVRDSRGRFSYTGAPDPTQVAKLEELIEFGRRHGVVTVLLLPPFTGHIYRVIGETPAQASYMQAVEQLVQDVARKHGLAFVNAHDMAALGVSDEQSYDGIHGDEVAYRAMLPRLLAASPMLAGMVDGAALAALMAREPTVPGVPGHHLIER